MRMLQLVPVAACETHSAPGTSSAKRSWMKAVSSSGFGAPHTCRSALTCITSSPETKEAMWKACTPMSAVVKEGPATEGSILQYWPLRSGVIGSTAQSWLNSTRTWRMRPSPPARTISLACRTIAKAAKP